MPSPLTIRRATRSDLPEVLRLVRALAVYEKLEDKFVATTQDYERTLFGQEACAEAWVGEFEGRIVGYVILFHTFSTFLGKRGMYLEDLYVEESLRGRGFGSQLFEFVVNLARERRCGRLEWSALDWNAPAIRFYEARGAKMLDDWRMFRLDEAGLQSQTD
jgi:GNAT superfamily N-acetyltransferase